MAVAANQAVGMNCEAEGRNDQHKGPEESSGADATHEGAVIVSVGQDRLAVSVESRDADSIANPPTDLTGEFVCGKS